MKFKSKYSGREYDLNPVFDTDFYEDVDGDLYTVEPNGYCLPQRASAALGLILRRKTQNCHQTCLGEARAIKNGFDVIQAELNNSWEDYQRRGGYLDER